MVISISLYHSLAMAGFCFVTLPQSFTAMLDLASPCKRCCETLGEKKKEERKVTTSTALSPDAARYVISTRTHTRTHTHARTRVHTLTYTHTRTHARTHARTHTHTHTHTHEGTLLTHTHTHEGAADKHPQAQRRISVNHDLTVFTVPDLELKI